jgi:predicted anti-sigma-YlaC factor YlaD
MNCKNARKKISLALDNRLEKANRESLQGHLDLCRSCRNWQQEQSLIQELFSTREVIEPGQGFSQKLQMKINSSSSPSRFFFLNQTVFQPILLRAAILLIMIFSALIGFSLGNRLNVPATGADAVAFNLALNMDAFADLPAESFGAVYGHLLQGDRP